VKKLLSCVVALCLGFAATTAFAQIGVVATGEATLTWNPPTQYVNGDPLPLSDIQRYTIYWGTESGVYSHSLDVENGAVTSRRVELEVTEPTTFYFVVTAWARGLESEYSNEASKSIDFEFEDVAPREPMNVTLDITMTCEITEAGRTCRVVVE